ncbi:MAG: hypothetical protein MUO75_01345 [Actinobacteria bacterium]|nr:hypothetical protein [Actinomycetota bacterium]
MMVTTRRSKSSPGLRLTRDAFNAALNAPSLEDANRMEDRNQAFVILSGLPEPEKSE